MLLLRLACGFAAPVLFVIAGVQMLQIRSVAADEFGRPSTAEEFYQACGWFSIGLAAVSFAIALKWAWDWDRGFTSDD